MSREVPTRWEASVEVKGDGDKHIELGLSPFSKSSWRKVASLMSFQQYDNDFL